MAGATLTVYNGGTLQLATVYQDINLINAAPNPMNADQTGRLPLFYVADGVYRIRLADQFGVLIYDYPQVASIGASTSGGGGTSVNATTIFQTGDVLWLDQQGIRAGWVRDNGRTIGSATSGASERANADCQNLFLFGWAAGWSVVGGRGLSAAADWAANKQITLPDKRGWMPAGLDGMGNARANKIADSHVSIAGPGGGLTADTPGAQGGETDHQLVLSETPSFPYTPHGTVTSGEDTEIMLSNGTRNVGAGAAGFGAVVIGVGFTFTGTPATLGGSNATHNNLPPFVLGTFFRKL